jgi:hypothetical protein
MRRLARVLAAIVSSVVLAAPGVARAQDAFEIQVYDYETATPGGVGFEFHANHFAVGSTGLSAAGELPTNHMTHLTLEPHIGIADWCEAGAYIQTAVRGDGGYDFAGLKLRFKARIPRRLAGVVGLALNFELSSVPEEYEVQRFGVELRPILDVKWKRLYLWVNPIVDIPIGGPTAGHPELQPAVKAAVRVAPFLSVGPEYYFAFGPLDAPLARDSQTHLLLGALDFDWFAHGIAFGLNVGAGYGFTGPDKVIVKAIFGMDFGATRPKAVQGE